MCTGITVDECREGYRDSRIHGVESAWHDNSLSCELFRVASVAEVLATGPRLGDWSPVCKTRVATIVCGSVREVSAGVGTRVGKGTREELPEIPDEKWRPCALADNIRREKIDFNDSVV